MIGDNFFFLNSVDSTNNYAMARVHAGLAKHGDLYFAWEQTAGKGQRGKEWLTMPGENITLSIVLEMQTVSIADQFLLIVVTALAASDFFIKEVNSEVSIKWPNDVYWRDRKAGGILIENVLQGNDWKYAVAGIGFNINQTNFPSGLSNPVSLKQITGKHTDTKRLAGELASSLEFRWKQLMDGDMESLMLAYNDRLYKKGERVKLKKDNILFETTVREVKRSGELVTEDAVVRLFQWGEVQWLIS